MLIQSCFFGAYFLVSLPAGNIVKKIGFQKGIVLGLVVAALGCLAFYPAASSVSYPLFLLALFILASGITILQVSANPFVSLLGDPKTASSRLTLTQAFNALGTTVAPFFGSYLILDHVAGEMSQAANSADAVQMPYILLAAMLLILGAIFAWLKLPVIEHSTTENTQLNETTNTIWEHKHLVLGAIAIFLYVGAEVSIGSFLVSFLNQPTIANLEEADAAKYIAYYWGGAMVGRFIGAVVMQKIAAGKILAINSTLAVALISIAIVTEGQVAMVSILLVGLCNSIMFPTIFSLALSGLGRLTSQGSGILCLAIVGGAIVPPAQGIFADSIGIQHSFILPILCYLFIVYYGLKGSVLNTKKVNF